MTSIAVLSRREALKLFGLSAGALVLCGKSAFSKKSAEPALQPLNLYVSIGSDERVDIVCQRTEMGQGVRTSFAMLIADELDVDWKNVRIVQADGDVVYGDQNTDGSNSIRLLWTMAREMGATARAMLISAAALEWQVSENECNAKNGVVTHAPSGRWRTYGSLAAKASTLKTQPSPTLKSHNEFKFIGKHAPAIDARDIVTGKAQFGIDIDIPNMLIASIERSPAIGGKVKSFQKVAALTVPGVKAVIKLDAQPQSINSEAGIAVVATNTWAALKGRAKLNVAWDLRQAKTDSDADRLATLRSALTKPGKLIRNDGDIESAIVSSTHSSDYYAPFLAHATMEPPAATASVTADLCEVWAPAQDPQRLRATVAKYLGVDEKRVVIHVTLLGGGFGRKSQTDFVIEAVELSRQLKKPVKVIFSREDDIKHCFYHADSLQVLTAGLDESGLPVTWEHKTAFPTYDTVFNANTTLQLDAELDMGARNLIYDIPNIKVEGFGVECPVKIGWFRSVNNLFHAFAINVFIDELSEKAKMNPVDYRLKLLAKPRKLSNEVWDKSTPLKQETTRMADLIRRVALQAKWGTTLPKGDYQGFASHYSFLTYAAAIATISVSDSGTIKVKRVDIGIDCGFIVNPDAVKAQLEGSVIFGISAALFGEINLDKGQVRQSNFHDYPVARISDCPEIHIYLAQNQEPPTGAGEPAVPPIAPAIASAIYFATGKRLRNLPLRI